MSRIAIGFAVLCFLVVMTLCHGDDRSPGDEGQP